MKKIIFLLPLLFLLSGCADYKEVNEMAIVSAVGIDFKNDEYVITLEVLNEKIDKNSSKVTTYTRTAGDKSIATAIEKAADLLSHRAYYSHVKLVVVSESVAKDHLKEITDFFIRSTYLRENFNMVVTTEASPEDILTTETSENPIASSAIILLLQTNGYASDYSIDKKYYVFFQEIADFGKDGALSVINVKEKDIYIDGLAVFDGYEMVDILDIDDAVLYNILINDVKKPVYYLEYEGKSFSVALYDNETKFEVDDKTIKVKGTYRAKIMNNGPNFDIKDQSVLTQIDEDFSKLVSEKVEKFIKTLQSKGTDILYLGDTYYIKTRDKNEDLWQSLKIETDIKVIINKKGLVYNIYENN